MGKEQGDEFPTDPPVYVRTVNGVEQERTALTPTDEVNLKAQGWVRKTGKRAGSRSGGNRGGGSRAADTGNAPSNG